MEIKSNIQFYSQNIIQACSGNIKSNWEFNVIQVNFKLINDNE